MATGNTNFTATSPSYAAAAIEKRIGNAFVDQVASQNALLACIKSNKLGFMTGYDVEGMKAIITLNYGRSAATTSTIGVSDANEIPTTFATVQKPGGITAAEYHYTHFREGIGITSSMEIVNAGQSRTQRGNWEENAASQLMMNFAEQMGNQMEGESNTAGRTKLLGLDYAIATGNSPGNIDQSDSNNSWWRGTVYSAGGPLSLSMIDDQMDTIRLQMVDKSPGKMRPGSVDLLLLSNAGGINTFGQLRAMIGPEERPMVADFYAEYGIEHYTYMNAKCVMSGRMPAGYIYGLDTTQWFFGGYETPQRVGEPQRIHNSDAFEHMFNWWGFLGCQRLNRNFKITNVT